MTLDGFTAGVIQAQSMSWEVITVLIGNMQCIWLEEPNDRVWDNHST